MIRQEGHELVYGTNVYMMSVIRPMNGRPATVCNGSHVALSAYDRVIVEHFTTLPLSMEGHPTVLRAFVPNTIIITTVPSYSIRMETRSKP